MLRVLSIFPTSNAYFSHTHVQDWRGLQACAAVIWEELHPQDMGPNKESEMGSSIPTSAW